MTFESHMPQLIDKVQQYNKELEYLQEVDILADMLNEYYEKSITSDVLINKIEYISAISAKIGNYTGAMHLWNQSNRVEKTQFFFPTRYSANESYTGYALLVSHELTRTGAPVVLQDMARVLKKNGYYVVMMSPYDGALRKELCEEGIPVIVDRHLEIGRFENECHQEGRWTTDVFVDAFEFTVFCTTVLHNAVVRYQNKGKPILWWLHEGSVSMEAVRGCLPLQLSEYVHVSYVCEYVREQMEKIDVYYEGDILNYGVSDSKKTYKQREHEKCIFITVATIDERKGQDVLLEAITLLPIEKLKKSEFWFVGKENEGPICMRLKMLEKGYPNIKCYGELPREQVLKLYEECDCMVCSSRDDPLPVVLTEMMIQEKPCICSDHTGTAYYIEDQRNGFIFQSENAEELSQKIMYVIDNKCRLEEIGKAGRKIYEQNLSMSIFEKKLLNLVKDLKG